MSTRDLLEELAARHGVAARYTTQGGEPQEICDSTLVYTLRALGVNLSDEPDDDELTGALFEDYLERASRPLPPAVVAPTGQERQFQIHVHDGEPAEVTIVLEDGTERPAYQDANDAPAADVDGQMWGEATFHIPGDLPLGYHAIRLASPGVGVVECPLIITPERLSTADKYVDNPVSGVMAQLYSVRSERSWGMGDLGDLGSLAEVLAKNAHADFLLVNPLHAAEPFPPVEDSPYLPTSRRFINPIYIRIEDVPELQLLDQDLRDDVAELAAEFQERNTSGAHIDRDTIFEAKLQVLRELYSLEFEPSRREAFLDYTRREGKGLEQFSRWCAEKYIEHHATLRHAISEEPEELSRFYSWLQFICDEQLAAAQQRALDAGMKIGLITDLAVGIHPGGSDAVNLADYLVPAASVGAPPDDYNQQGQDWSQPPWHPIRLAEAAYQPWRDMLSTVLRHSGGVRVDHVLGLFRLYWIPRMQSPTLGTYVSYDYEAMLGILALEAERAGAVFVGEDLGTVEPWVQDVLAARGVLGTNIVWFETEDDGSPTPPERYRPLALSSVGTHDLPPTLAYLRGDHITLRDELGVLTTDPAEEFAADLAWQAEVFNAVADAGKIPHRNFATPRREERGDETQLMGALHAYVASSRSALTCTNLVDMVGDIRAQNQPGTTKEVYPNWCIPLCDSNGTPVLIEQLASLPLFKAIAAASKRPGK